MTPLRWSLVLNVVLLGVVLLALGLPPKRSPAAGVYPDMTNRQLRVERRIQPATVTPEVVETNEPFHWSQLESEDYRVYVTNLQAVGCPPETIQDIIRADVQTLFERKVADLVSLEAANFWTAILDTEAFEKKVNEKAEALETLQDERDEMLEALLGPESSWRDVDTEVSQIQQNQAANYLLDYLSAEKRVQVLAVQQRFAELRQATQTEPDPEWAREQGRAALIAARQKRVEDLHQQEQQALRGILSASEYQELQLRTAFQSSRLRQAVGFTASEEELKALTDLERQFSGPTGVRRNTTASAERRAALEAYLGSQRLVAYERAQDQRFANAYHFVRRNNLASDLAPQIYELQREAEESLNKVRNDRRLAEEQRREQAAALGEFYRTSLTNALGTSFDLYSRAAGGWLNHF